MYQQSRSIADNWPVNQRLSHLDVVRSDVEANRLHFSRRDDHVVAGSVMRRFHQDSSQSNDAANNVAYRVSWLQSNCLSTIGKCNVLLHFSFVTNAEYPCNKENRS